MVLRSPLVHKTSSLLQHCQCLTAPTSTLLRQRRNLHSSLPAPPIPSPTPFVPDPQTFLTLIGRQLSTHAAKIPTWDTLFSLTALQLRELGVEPARSRRYLLWWREKFRQGEYGIGGDLKEVTDGVGEVRVMEMEVEAEAPQSAQQGMVKRMVVVDKKVAEDLAEQKIQKEDVQGVKGAKVKKTGEIVGNGFEIIKGSQGRAARLKIKDGLWEVRRGHKVHGGERRRKNILSRIAARERGTLK